MFRYIFNRVVGRRHFWRHASFGEVSELYVSRILRIVGINVASGFASVYMYQLGYSIAFLASFWAIYFFSKLFILPLAARYIAHFGPKHGILISNIFFIPAMIALVFLEQFGLASVIVWGVSLAISTSLYVVSYLVDFSKVKSVEHAGRELGFMNIFEKLAAGISPILGGLVALFFGPQTVMLVGAFVFLISALPLFRTGEQIKLRQKLDIKGFPWRSSARSLISRLGTGFDYTASIIAWSLFLVVVVFTNFGNEVYVTLGALSSVAVLAAVVTSYIYGRIIDHKRGGDLMKYGVLLNVLIHISRPFVSNPAGVVTTNVINEIASAGFSMPYMRGIFDAADSSGHRIIYITLSELFANLGAAAASLVMLGSVVIFGEIDGLRYFFFFAAISTPLILVSKFKLYQK